MNADASRTVRNRTYTRDDDLDRKTIAARNVQRLLAQGVAPGVARRIVGPDLVPPLCRVCGAPAAPGHRPGRPRKICGSAACEKALRRWSGALGGHGGSGRRLTDEHRAKIADGIRGLDRESDKPENTD